MIILQCILDKKKLRIRFHSYINDEDQKIFTNVYDNSYNCQFPKDIREEGRFYEIKDRDMCLIDDGMKTPFYKVKKQNIRILSEEESEQYKEKETVIDITSLKIYDAIDCVVCLSVESNVVFIPCAHRCVCKECYSGIKTTKNICPLCRQNIARCIT